MRVKLQQDFAKGQVETIQANTKSLAELAKKVATMWLSRSRRAWPCRSSAKPRFNGTRQGAHRAPFFVAGLHQTCLMTIAAIPALKSSAERIGHCLRPAVVAQLVRASVCGTEGRWFKSTRLTTPFSQGRTFSRSRS